MVSTLELELALPFSLISSSCWRSDRMINVSDFLRSFEGNWLMIFVLIQFLRKCKLHLKSWSLDTLLAVPISWANSTSFILVISSLICLFCVTLIWIVHFSSKCWQIISNLYPFQDIPTFFICSVFIKPNLLSDSPLLSGFHSKFILSSANPLSDEYLDRLFSFFCPFSKNVLLQLSNNFPHVQFSHFSYGKRFR